MANEITATAGLALSNGLLKHSSSNTTFRLDQTTARKYDAVHDIGTSEETITFGDVVPGYIELENLDATNYVNWGNVTGNLDQKLSNNGGKAVFEFVSATGALILQANTATCKVRITAFNV